MATPIKPDAPPPRRLFPGHFIRDATYQHDRSEGIYDWLLVFTIDGAGEIHWPGGHLVTSVGDVVLFEPDSPHGYRTDPATGHWNLLWAHFEPTPTWRSWLAWPWVAPGIRSLSLADPHARQQVQHHLEQTNRLYAAYMPHYLELALNALEAAILWCDQQNPTSAFARLDPRLRRALDHIARHLAQPMSIPEIAGDLGLSTSRFAHLFRNQLGISPQRFIEERRIERARHLLEHTNIPIAEVAEAAGFQDPFYFSLRFKRATGANPRAFRKQFQNAGRNG